MRRRTATIRIRPGAFGPGVPTGNGVIADAKATMDRLLAKAARDRWERRWNGRFPSSGRSTR